jgi:ribosomal protein L37AE/L43A
MSVYYGYSCSASPYVVARYACRCGRIHGQYGALHVRYLPPGWDETSDLAGQPEPECPRCHKKTVARRKAAAFARALTLGA